MIWTKILNSCDYISTSVLLSRWTKMKLAKIIMTYNQYIITTRRGSWHDILSLYKMTTISLNITIFILINRSNLWLSRQRYEKKIKVYCILKPWLFQARLCRTRRGGRMRIGWPARRNKPFGFFKNASFCFPQPLDNQSDNNRSAPIWTTLPQHHRRGA